MDTREKVRGGENVIFIVRHKDGTETVHVAENIVGDEGDLYYAERGAAQAPTNTFDTLELGTAGAAPGKSSDRSNMTSKIASSQKTPESGYPKTNDGDADNSGKGTDIVTWKFAYAKGAITGTDIDRGIITIAAPAASEKLLTYFTFGAAFTLTSDDELKAVYVNHTFTGV